MRPRDPIELLVARVWAEVLERPFVGVRDTFASLGGDHHRRQRMLERIARETGLNGDLDLTPGAVTVEALASRLKHQSEAFRQRARAFWARNVEAPPETGRVPLFFFHGDREGGLSWFETLGRLGSDQPVYGIAPHITSGAPIPETVEAIAASHLQLVREIDAAGPYLLGGHCNGAVATVEAAHQLLRGGEQVVGVILVSPLLPATYKRGVIGFSTRFLMPLLDRAGMLVFRIRRRSRRALRLPGRPRPWGRIQVDEWGGELYERYSTILQAYLPPQLSIPASILWPRAEPRRFRLPSHWAWRQALPAARFVEIHGSHMGCAIQHSGATAREVRRAIDILLGESRD